mmetsp:Transcript_29255/g.48341  ORF Transcript_29255/g.48341 Transcript_29255/m.48341 type:complete len:200 (+) Transcript_29255:788-1387(+)
MVRVLLMVWWSLHSGTVMMDFLGCLVKSSKTAVLLTVGVGVGVHWRPIGWVWTLTICHSVPICASFLVGTCFLESSEGSNAAIVTSPSLRLKIDLVRIAVLCVMIHFRSMAVAIAVTMSMAVSMPMPISIVVIPMPAISFVALRMTSILWTVRWATISTIVAVCKLPFMRENGRDNLFIHIFRRWAVLHELIAGAWTQR